MIDDERILDDFKKILKYLGIKERIWLHLVPDSNEGFWDKERNTVLLGTKPGYNRRLLVHECVHILGKQHYTDKDGYESVIRFDTYSARLELKIFGE